MFIITKETAEGYRKASTKPEGGPAVSTGLPTTGGATPLTSPILFGSGEDKRQEVPGKRLSDAVTWSGEIPPQKWMNFYTKVLTKLGVSRALTLSVKVECKPEGGISPQKLEELRGALRELGLDDKIE
jgi:hypothetical protein